MDCNKIKDMITLYIDGELEDEGKKQVEEHISNCLDCKKELEEYKKIIHILENIADEEPPKGYCKRLHEKLLSVAKQNKTRKRIIFMKYGSIAAALLLVVLAIYVSTGRNDFIIGNMSKSQNDMDYGISSPESAPESPQEFSSSDDMIKEESNNSDRGVTDFTSDKKLITASLRMQDEREMKIIKSGSLITETPAYDEFLKQIIEKVELFDGYVEQNNTNVNQIYQDKKLKYGNFKIRVPQDKFYEFVEYLESISDIRQKNINEIDVTKDYYEKDNRVKNLELQENHLRELFEKANTVEEMLLIENELRRIRTEIDLLNISLKDIDDRASMSTVTLEVQEVLKPNINISDGNSVWEKAKEGFINTINAMVLVGENILVALVSLIPVLIIGIIVIIVVVILWKKIRKNKM